MAGGHEFPNPLNRLNAGLSLLQLLDHCRTPICSRDCDWEALSRPISHPHTGRSSHPPRSRPLRGLNCAIVVLYSEKTKGQQLKGKIASALLHTFSHFSALFHTFRIFPRTFVKLRPVYKRIKEKDQTILHVSCCTFVLL